MGQNGAGSNNSNDVKDESRRQLVIDIPDNLEDLLSQPALWPEICIYRVPRKLRAISPSAYTPQMISIGPFHHNEKSLKPMEKHKLRYLAEFCRRTGKNWADLAEKIIEWEEKIRHCYDQTFESYESNMFVKMILLDSVFIIEFFLRRGENFISTEKYKADYMLGKPSREHGILEDLILLENQLPYFVLEDLYEFATGNSGFLSLVSSNLLDYLLPPRIDDDDHKKNRSCDCFSICYGFWISNRFCCQKGHKDDESTSVEGKEIEEKPKHLTDLVRRSRSYKHPVSNNDACIESLYSATKLHEAGVKFKVDKKAWPLDIKFERGELKMPRFEVHDGTERLIRNLMAFEQCHYPNDPYICDYILILDFLVDTEKDVELLIQNGIITNLLGECKSVAKMVNKLCLEITTSGSCFYGVSVDLNKHYENPWFKTVAIMRSVYFSDLWRGTGTIAAVILLFLTFIQSVYSLSRIF